MPRVLNRIAGGLACLAIAFGALLLVVRRDAGSRESDPVAAPTPPSTFHSPTVNSTADSAHATDPYGNPWPPASGYLPAALELATGGLSTITVDNTRNEAHVHVKLVTSDAYPLAVREFFVSKGGSFTLRNVTPGSYELRYRDLASGLLLRTQSFEVREADTAQGVRYSNIQLSLYKVADGNLQTERIPEGAF